MKCSACHRPISTPSLTLAGMVFGPVCDLVALHCGPAFGKPIVNVTNIEDAEVPIKRRIKRHTKKHASGLEPEQVDY